MPTEHATGIREGDELRLVIRYFGYTNICLFLSCIVMAVYLPLRDGHKIPFLPMIGIAFYWLFLGVGILQGRRIVLLTALASYFIFGVLFLTFTEMIPNGITFPENLGVMVVMNMPAVFLLKWLRQGGPEFSPY